MPRRWCRIDRTVRTKNMRTYKAGGHHPSIRVDLTLVPGRVVEALLMPERAIFVRSSDALIQINAY